MKKFSVFVVFALLCLAMITGGMFICNSPVVSNAARSSDVQEVEGVNYNNFNDPRMLTSDEDYIYLIDRTVLGVDDEGDEDIQYAVTTINRTDGRTVAPSVILPIPEEGLSSSSAFAAPRQMKLESDGRNSYIFVFYQRQFAVFNAADLAKGVYNPLKLDGETSITYKTPLQTSSAYAPFFNVHYRATQQGFMLIWGRANTYNYTHYTIIAAVTPNGTGTVTTSSLSSSLITHSLEPAANETAIDGIVHDSREDSFLLAYSNLTGQARFFKHKGTTLTQLSPEIFTDVSSLNYLPAENKFVFLSNVGGSRITWFNPSTGEYDFVELRTIKNFHTETTNNPVFVTVQSATEIFVIDGNNDQRGSKKSIDQYHFTPESGTIKFFEIVAATWGDDNGFYYFPSAMAVIGSGKYIVADLSGQVALTDLNSTEVPHSFIDYPAPAEGETSSARDGDVISMVYDNFKHVYMYDSVNGIRKFDLNGNLVKTESTDSAGKPFGKITQLIASPDQTIFALDSGSNKIYRSSGTSFEEIMKTRTFTLIPETRGAVHDELNALILTSVSFSGTKSSTAIELSSSNTVSAAISVSELNAANSEELVMDIVFDVRGNALTLVKITPSAPDTAERYELRRHVLTEKSFVLSPDFDSEMNSNMQVYPQNAGLTLDRLNSRLYYIGAHHAIEYIDLRADLWTFNDWTFSEDEETWTSAQRKGYSRTEDISPWKWTEGETPLPSNFAEAEKDVAIYDYPSALFESTLSDSGTVVPAGGIMKILEQNAVFDAGEEDSATFTNYLYVMYEADTLVYYGYVRRSDIKSAKPYQDPNFVPNNRHKSGRVIYDQTRIYQYPSADNSVVLGKIKRNYNGADENIGTDIEGLQLTNLVTVHDQLSRAYYEICISPTLDTNGTQLLDPTTRLPLYHPDSGGNYVGYVSFSGVIDYYKEPSDKPFIANASITDRTDSCQVYVFDGRNYTPIENELLAEHTAVYVRAPDDIKQKPYTYIRYLDAYGYELDGYVESRLVAINGVTLLQVISLIAIVLAIALVIFLIVWRVKRERKNKFSL